jgi:hypothetical protein
MGCAFVSRRLVFSHLTIGLVALSVVQMALWSLPSAAALGSIGVTSVINTGTYNADEMTIDRVNGDIYLDGTSTVGGNYSVVKVNGGSLTTLYSPLPATTGGNLTYTNGLAVDTSQLWWNNANAGPGSNTEISRAPKTGAGPITRNSPADDLDSFAYDGTTLYTAYYAGILYSVDGSGNLNNLGFYRGTSHLALAADLGTLYVADDSGTYSRSPGGTFSNITNVANTYRTNGERLAVGGGSLWALDRNNLNGFWQIPLVAGSPTFYTDPSFVNLKSIGYFNGQVFLADSGEVSGTNLSGHVWAATVPEPAAAGVPTVLAATALARRNRRPHA